jgi:hypothetical protein
MLTAGGSLGLRSAALATDADHGSEHTLEPHGPFLVHKPERDEPSGDGARTDGHTDEPGGVDLVSPKTTIDALFPAFLFLAFWYGQAALMFLLLGFENKGRSIEEINRALDTRAGVALDPVRVPAR